MAEQPISKKQSAPQLDPIKAAEAPHYTRVLRAGMSEFVWIDPKFSTDPAVFEQAITEVCSDEDVRAVLFWDNRDAIPPGFPLSHDAVGAQIAQYNRNPATGSEQFFYIRNGNKVLPTGSRPLSTPVPDGHSGRSAESNR